MYVELPRDMTVKLAALPEEGMGYQYVDVRLKDGRRIPWVIVINCAILSLPDKLGVIRTDDILDIVAIPRRDLANR